MTPLFLRTAQASGEHWGTVVKAALAALGPLPDNANFGLCYVTPPLAEDLSSITTFLRETTPIKHWTVAVTDGLIGPIGTVRARPALVLLVAALPEGSFLRFDGWDAGSRGKFLAANAAWLAAHPMAVALGHGDVGRRDLAKLLREFAAATGAFLVGGAVPLQPGGLAGVLLGPPLTLVTGLTQGCQPVGHTHRVTEARGDVIMALDGAPALEVMTEIAPDIAADLRRAAGVIHIGLPVAGADRADYLVRPITAIDPDRGWLAVAGAPRPGEQMMFVRRDAAGARADLRRMLKDLARRTEGRRPLGGIYVSCVARGAGLFGADETETTMIKESLGDFPLIGLLGQGEFCHDRLYAYSGVLALVLS